VANSRKKIEIELTSVQRQKVRRALGEDLKRISVSDKGHSGFQIVAIDDLRPTDSPEGIRRC